LRLRPLARWGFILADGTGNQRAVSGAAE